MKLLFVEQKKNAEKKQTKKPHTQKTKKQKMSYNINPLYLNKERTNICIRKPRRKKNTVFCTK